MKVKHIWLRGLTTSTFISLYLNITQQTDVSQPHFKYMYWLHKEGPYELVFLSKVHFWIAFFSFSMDCFHMLLFSFLARLSVVRGTWYERKLSQEISKNKALLKLSEASAAPHLEFYYWKPSIHNPTALTKRGQSLNQMSVTAHVWGHRTSCSLYLTCSRSHTAALCSGDSRRNVDFHVGHVRRSDRFLQGEKQGTAQLIGLMTVLKWFWCSPGEKTVKVKAAFQPHPLARRSGQRESLRVFNGDGRGRQDGAVCLVEQKKLLRKQELDNLQTCSRIRTYSLTDSSVYSHQTEI